MSTLIQEITHLQKTPVAVRIQQRLADFQHVQQQNNDVWHAELCYCLLTANAKARIALAIQEELGIQGFKKGSFELIRDCIYKHKHRFHNNKAQYIVDAQQHKNIKKMVQDRIKNDGQQEARLWLAQTIKGFGLKEASHYLRNVGYVDLAVLDRHILNVLVEYGYIQQKPKTLNLSMYLQLEGLFRSIAYSCAMSCAELDLYMWYMKGNDVLK
ncbi:MAG: N-glycosylase/DNA lyase [Candidatus Woesearchaeota archaeon]